MLCLVFPGTLIRGAAGKGEGKALMETPSPCNLPAEPPGTQHHWSCQLWLLISVEKPTGALDKESGHQGPHLLSVLPCPQPCK